MGCYEKPEFRRVEPIIMEELHGLMGGVIRAGHDNSYELPWLWVTSREGLSSDPQDPRYTTPTWFKKVRSVFFLQFTQSRTR